MNEILIIKFQLINGSNLSFCENKYYTAALALFSSKQNYFVRLARLHLTHDERFYSKSVCWFHEGQM